MIGAVECRLAFRSIFILGEEMASETNVARENETGASSGTASDTFRPGLHRTLRKRARRLRQLSWAVLGAIVVVVAACFCLFYAAGGIAAQEESLRSRSEAEQFFDVIRGSLEKGGAGWGGTLNFSSDQVSKAFQDNLEKYLQSRNDGRSSFAFTISTLTTRVGAILILIFFVQILFALYRYNMRLAAHYDGQADAFELASDRPDLDLAMLADMLSVRHIDFGKTPRTPSDQVIQLVKGGLSRGQG